MIASPLEWTDVPIPNRWQRKQIEPGDEVPFDICHTDAVVAPILVIPSESAQFGRFRFEHRGIYTIEIQLRIDAIFRTTYIQTDVQFDPENPLEADFSRIKVSRRKPRGLLV
jgi:hypothetical protein